MSGYVTSAFESDLCWLHDAGAKSDDANTAHDASCYTFGQSLFYKVHSTMAYIAVGVLLYDSGLTEARDPLCPWW